MCETFASAYLQTYIVIRMLHTIPILMHHLLNCKHFVTGVGILQQEVLIPHLFRKHS